MIEAIICLQGRFVSVDTIVLNSVIGLFHDSFNKPLNISFFILCPGGRRIKFLQAPLKLCLEDICPNLHISQFPRSGSWINHKTRNRNLPPHIWKLPIMNVIICYRQTLWHSKVLQATSWFRKRHNRVNIKIPHSNEWKWKWTMQNTLDEEIRCRDRLNNLGELIKINECLDE